MHLHSISTTKKSKVRLNRVVLLGSVLILLACALLSSPVPINAQGLLAPTPSEQTFEAIIQSVSEPTTQELYGQPQQVQTYNLLITKGSAQGQTVSIQQPVPSNSAQPRFQQSEKVILTKTTTPQGEEIYYLVDHVRRDGTFLLFGIFLAFVLTIARKKGISALLGLIVSFAIIFKTLIPLISLGIDPVISAIATAAIIIPITFTLTHGFNLKTAIAILGTLISLIFTGILATGILQLTHITGLGTEEATFVQMLKGPTFNLQGLVLAGIIISTLGVLDDITISQAAIVAELKAAAHKLTQKDLYSRAMNVGQDHIASLVNTLILVYTGAALPLLILFTDSSQSYDQLLNTEFIAEEIIRMLLSSIGLIAAVPITTYLATLAATHPKTKALFAKHTTTHSHNHH